MNADCRVCGSRLKAPARFCNVCGTAREAESPETIQGMQAFEAGEYREAQRLFERVVKQEPKSALARRDAGHAAFHLNEYEKALDHYQAALRIHPKLLDAHYNLGIVHMRRGRVNDALKEFFEALDLIHPVEAGRFYLGLFHSQETLAIQCRLHLGQLLRQRGDLEQAIEQFKRILKDFPKNVSALGNMGDCYLALEQYPEAVKLYRRVLQMLPEGADRISTHNDLGVAYFRMEKMERAAEQFKTVLRESPDHLNAVYNLGRLYQQEGMTGRMREDFAELIRTSRDPATLLSLLVRSMASMAPEKKASPAMEENLLIGDSAAMRQVKELIKRAAASDATVLVLGENGTGKEMVARSIHQMSSRYDKPFAPIACSALSESLLESELFGHEKGSFTGATGRKIGKFEAANLGTVFLDEIGEISPSTQVKLLRFLQEREFERVGGTETVQVNLRIIAATNRDLKKAIPEGRFREDLYYRLNVITVELPPLRERDGDLAPLITHFLAALKQRRPHRFEGATPDAMAYLKRYHWPGNVRELENIVERVVTLYDDTLLRPEHLPEEIRGGREAWVQPKTAAAPASGYALQSAEREVILRVLKESKFNKKLTALKLGISRPTLYLKMRKYGLESKSA